MPLERTDILPPQERVLAGKYRLERLLGEGGMGTVYEATHVGLGTRLAVKLLAEQYANHETIRKRFRREARAAAAIRHPNVITVTDTGEDEEGVPFLVMELLEGESLASVARRARKLTPEMAGAVVYQLLSGLSAAHAEGVIHRDLKPANVFLELDESGETRLKILDFGISKFAGDIESGVTGDGAMIGTPSYMPPEQCGGAKNVDGRADLYAVGVILYRLVCGVLPFRGKDRAEIYGRVLDGRFTPVRDENAELSDELAAVIERALQKDPDARWQTARAFADALLEAVPDLVHSKLPPVLPRSRDRVSSASVPPLEKLRSEDDTKTRPAKRQPTHTRPDGVAARAEGEAKAAESRAAVPRPADAAATTQSHPPPEPVSTTRMTLAAVAFGLAVAVGGAALFLTLSGSDEEAAADVEEPAATFDGPPVRYGVARYTERDAVEAAHRPLAEFLQRRLERPVELVLVEPHELTERLARGDVELAALSAYRYVQMRRTQEGLRLLAVAQMPGGSTYEGLIISPVDSGIETLADLEGRSFCYVDPDSSSGYVYPRALMRRAGLDPDETLGAVRFTGDHATSLRLVSQGVCDAAAVYRSLFFDTEQTGIEPARFRIVASTARIPNDAYCAAATVDDDTADALRAALLALAPGSEEASRVLAGGDLRGFVAGEDAQYDGVREIAAHLDERDPE